MDDGFEIYGSLCISCLASKNPRLLGPKVLFMVVLYGYPSSHYGLEINFVFSYIAIKN